MKAKKLENFKKWNEKLTIVILIFLEFFRRLLKI